MDNNRIRIHCGHTDDAFASVLSTHKEQFQARIGNTFPFSVAAYAVVHTLQDFHLQSSGVHQKAFRKMNK